MKFHGVGRLVADPKLVKVNDTCKVEFSLAYNYVRGKGDDKKREAHFFDYTAWDTGAQMIADRCKKGDLLYVEGNVKQEKWEDKETGQKRSKNVYRVSEFNFMQKRDDKEEEVENTNKAPF